MHSCILVLLSALFFLVPVFGAGEELTLLKAVELALANHPEIKQAELQVSLAKLQLSAVQAQSILPALSLSLIPSLGTLPQAGLSASMSFPVGTSSKLVGSVSLPSWNSSWNVNFSLSLDLANPMAASESLFKLTQAVDSALASLEKTRATVIVNVIKGYLDVLSLEAQVKQAESTKNKAEQNLKAMEEKVAAGLAGELDLLEARLSLVQAELAHQQARNNYQTQKARFLREYMGLEGDVVLTPVSLNKEKLVSAAKTLLDSLNIEEAVEAASEVKAAKDEVEEAKKTLDRTRLFWLPTISLEIAAGPEGLKLGWSIQFDLFSPDHAAQLQMCEVALTLAELNLEAARSTARQRISDQFAALLSALQALEQLPLEEEQWALKERINRSKYEAGLLSESDWFDFQRQKEAFMLEAQQRLANVLLAYLNLQAALGLSVEWEGWWE